MHEDIPIFNYLVPKEFTHDNGKLTGVMFEKVKAVRDAKGRRNLVPTGEPDQHFPLRRRAGRGRPGERVSLDRARFRHRVRQMGHAQGRSEDHGLHPSQSVLRRRRRVRAEEHHLGGGARPRGRDLDRQALPRRGHQRAPAAAGRGVQPEDGHPRVELRQRDHARQALPGAAARQGGGAARHQGGGRARLRPGAGAEGGRALPQLRRADRVHRPALHRMRRLRRHLPDGLHHLHRERRRSRAAQRGCRRRRRTSPRTSMSPTASRPAASW